MIFTYSPEWKKKGKTCYFCGGKKSVMFMTKLGKLEVDICSKCAVQIGANDDRKEKI